MNTREEMYCVHCDMKEVCDRKKCNRGMVFYANGNMKMEEPKLYNIVRKPELTRAFKEGRVVKENF